MVSPRFEPAAYAYHGADGLRRLRGMFTFAVRDVQERILLGVAVGLAHHPHDSEVVRRHVDTFAFPAFTRRLAAALHQ